MAIATLSTLSTSLFRGNKNLSFAGSSGLAGQLNTIISKVNEVIAGLGDLDTLEVGAGTGAYYGGSNSYFSVDGTNPPTLMSFRIQDLLDGSWATVTCNNKVLIVS